jgi:hypothetical protein
MSGCPQCGSDRLKAAPLALVSTLAAPWSPLRRYGCPACGWHGWRRRLRRRHQDLPSLAQHRAPTRAAGVFFAGVLLFLLVTGVLLMRSCGPTTSGPAPISRLVSGVPASCA